MSLVEPAQSLGTVLVKVRMSLMRADMVESMSQIIAELQQWFRKELSFLSPNSSSIATLAEVVEEGSKDGFVLLKISRALWHCFMP